jgi:hypothetical protein
MGYKRDVSGNAIPESSRVFSFSLNEFSALHASLIFCHEWFESRWAHLPCFREIPATCPFFCASSAQRSGQRAVLPGVRQDEKERVVVSGAGASGAALDRDFAAGFQFFVLSRKCLHEGGINNPSVGRSCLSRNVYGDELDSIGFSYVHVIRDQTTVAAVPRCIAARLPIAAREHFETLLMGLRKLAAQMRHFLILISHSGNKKLI